MFLRTKVRKKDGKQHRYFSVVENCRVGQNRTVQRTAQTQAGIAAATAATNQNPSS